jgi:hypothetical protein
MTALDALAVGETTTNTFSTRCPTATDRATRRA